MNLCRTLFSCFFFYVYWRRVVYLNLVESFANVLVHLLGPVEQRRYPDARSDGNRRVFRLAHPDNEVRRADEASATHSLGNAAQGLLRLARALASFDRVRYVALFLDLLALKR